jgi:NDP-sugar pyrophosphorylase family protein
MYPVIIMAGGRGARLRPFTDSTPKPLIRIGDRPLVAHNITALAKAGFTNIILSLNYLPEQFHATLGDGLQFGASIQYYVEPEPRGTAGSIPEILSTFSIPQAQHTIVLNADILTDLSWRDIHQYHQESRNDLTIATTKFSHNLEYGVVVGGGRVVEKPCIQVPILAGAYILSPAAIATIPPKCQSQMPDIINAALDNGLIGGSWEIPGFWLDVGRPADLDRAHERVQLIAA